MATPNMATITASLERSLQNCSLNHQQSSSSSSSTTTTSGGGGGGAAHGSDSPPNPAAEAALELNSEGSLPFHWEQCLDLKTGEIYYINWRTGMKAKEDPRNTAAVEYGGGGGEYYSEDDNSSYDSEGSSSESCPSSSREQWSYQENYNCQEDNENEDKNNNNNNNNNSGNVLVVAGCKSCLMYYMVPKQLDVCPKCCGQLLHFDRSENLSN